MSLPTERALRHIFEAYDGTGLPDRLVKDLIPQAVYVVALAGDLEILSRCYDVSTACSLILLILLKADVQYPSRSLSYCLARRCVARGP